MTAPILFTIWLAWIAMQRITTDYRWASPVAGLACAAFGVWYY